MRVEKLEAGFGQRRCLLGVSLEVREGEIVALLGANGAGKTTTLMAISGLVPVSSGETTFEGAYLWTRASNKNKRSSVGVKK